MGGYCHNIILSVLLAFSNIWDKLLYGWHVCLERLLKVRTVSLLLVIINMVIDQKNFQIIIIFIFNKKCGLYKMLPMGAPERFHKEIGKTNALFDRKNHFN